MIRPRRAILVLLPVSPVACWLSQSRWPAALSRFANATGGCCEADPLPSSALRI